MRYLTHLTLAIITMGRIGKYGNDSGVYKLNLELLSNAGDLLMMSSLLGWP